MDNRGVLENLEQSGTSSSRENLRGRFPGRTSSGGHGEFGAVWNVEFEGESSRKISGSSVVWRSWRIWSSLERRVRGRIFEEDFWAERRLRVIEYWRICLESVCSFALNVQLPGDLRIDSDGAKYWSSGLSRATSEGQGVRS